ncbi:MAG: type II toxin-antitoxin system VapC family toxin, partial [Thermodesulfobacteriota bacterium]|nr:type II toxin-antitoxin system VapC family toxin [Thermodesulfobacteriota bacterium]
NGIGWFFLSYNSLFLYALLSNYHISTPTDNMPTLTGKMGMRPLSDAIEIIGLAEDLLKENEYEINSFQVLQLTNESGCSAYDCEFVSLAKDLGIPLITEDKKVLLNFPETAISMGHFIDISKKDKQ